MEVEQLIGKNWSAIRQAARAFLSQLPLDAFDQNESLRELYS